MSIPTMVADTKAGMGNPAELADSAFTDVSGAMRPDWSMVR